MRNWIMRGRTFAGWLVLAACVSFFIASRYVSGHYPAMGYFSPRPPQSLLLWRNGSLIAVAVCILISIPRWQSLVGIAALVVFLLFFGG
jgi:hypothetical protein